MKPLEHRQHIIVVIEEALSCGARLARACEEAGIAPCTFRRWQAEGRVLTDQRPAAQRPEPANKLAPQERENLLSVFSEPEYASLPPSQVVPALADKDVYLASESTCYRVLHAAGQQHEREDGHANASSAPSPMNTRPTERTRHGPGTSHG
jgi:putative transposase